MRDISYKKKVHNSGFSSTKIFKGIYIIVVLLEKKKLKQKHYHDAVLDKGHDL